MSSFAFIHGGGDSGWAWHLVEAALRERGHVTVAPDLPAGSPSATLDDYADAVHDAIEDRDREVVLVAHSYGGFTAPLVADRLPAARLVFITAMVPRPGESPADWWANTGYREASQAQAAADGGLTGNDDPRVCFLHDVPDDLADEALGREREHPSPAADGQPWPLPALPDVPTRFVVCAADRMFPPAFQHRLARERLGITAPDEIASGHCPGLSRPAELARLLHDLA